MMPRAEQEKLREQARFVDAARREFIKRQILEFDRIDLLATEVLGLDFAKHHLQMVQHQVRNSASLILAARGFGKTTVCTVLRIVHMLLKNPNKRILIVSKSSGNAQDMLNEIKANLLSPPLQEMFGPQAGLAWGALSIVVAGRTLNAKEPSVACVGLESAVVSKHYDAIFCDDLVDEENARSPRMRQRTLTFFFKHVLPTLEPSGELHILGTRYHGEDLYGHLMAETLEASQVLRVPAMTGSDEVGWTSTWPEKWPVEILLKRRRDQGSIIFASQYLCVVEVLSSGGIFSIENCTEVREVPKRLPIFMGVDLAISKKATADYFSATKIAYDRAKDLVYVIRRVKGRFSFYEQRILVAKLCDEWRVAKCAVEAVNYEAALIQELRRKRPDLPIVRIRPPSDKITRGHRLSARFERGGIVFLPGNGEMIASIIAFPNGAHDDDFDSLDHAVTIATRRGRRRNPADAVGLM